ncbi:MAG TPA: hypothetical protein VHN78_16590 [Chloroflexota bacterium]|jgi:hypothetical protein|nr:hypothetical protein [Chloroflexota bacterium]HEX2187114.1 hypothetical protein [Chloroflexota bacterium]
MTTPAELTAPPAETPPDRVPLREGPQAAPIDPGSFRETLAALKAAPGELKWASIPWQTDLWEARKLAAEQGKPIFMWAMNGNPLGCV